MKIVRERLTAKGHLGVSILVGLIACALMWYITRQVGWFAYAVVGLTLGVTIAASLAMFRAEGIGRGLILFARDFFLCLAVLYLALLLAETVSRGFVSSIMGLNHMIPVLLVVGIPVILFTMRYTKTADEKPAARLYPSIPYLVGLVAFVLVWYVTRDVGWFSYAIAGLAGFTMILASAAVFKEREES